MTVDENVPIKIMVDKSKGSSRTDVQDVDNQKRNHHVSKNICGRKTEYYN